MVRRIDCLGKVSLFLLCLVFIQASAVGQGNVGINTTGAAPRNVTILDIVSPDKGVLLPRIDLQAANVAAPVNTPANGLMVYNTATTSLAGVNAQYNVTPGFYTWDALGSRWVRFIAHTTRPLVYTTTNAITTTNIAWSLLDGLESQSFTLRAGDRVELQAAGGVTTTSTGHAEGIAAISVNDGGGYDLLPNNTGQSNFSLDNDIITILGTPIEKFIAFKNWTCMGYFVAPADGNYTFAVRMRRTTGNTNLRAGSIVSTAAENLSGTLKVEIIRP